MSEPSEKARRIHGVLVGAVVLAVVVAVAIGIFATVRQWRKTAYADGLITAGGVIAIFVPFLATASSNPISPWARRPTFGAAVTPWAPPDRMLSLRRHDLGIGGSGSVVAFVSGLVLIVAGFFLRLALT